MSKGKQNSFFLKNTSAIGCTYEVRTKKLLLKDPQNNILQINYKKKWGEIDLIVQSGKTLKFVEVRYRQRDSLQSGSESLKQLKVNRIKKTAMLFLNSYKGNATEIEFNLIEWFDPITYYWYEF